MPKERATDKSIKTQISILDARPLAQAKQLVLTYPGTPG